MKKAPELDQIQMLFDLLTLLSCLRQIIEIGEKACHNQINEDDAWNQILDIAESSIADLGEKSYLKGEKNAA